jgi:preprotein translocase subunit YajC
MSFPTVPALLLQAPAPSGGGAPLAGLLFQFGAIFLIFWFLLIRPQQKQRKQQEQALLALKKGDAVVTAGGIVAEVVHIKESLKDGQPRPSLDDHVTIKSGDARLIVERGRIARVVGPTAA